MTDRTKIPAAQAGATPAEELRAAATKLRATAVKPLECIEPICVGDLDEWTKYYCHECEDLPEGDAPWITVMTPLLAEPLADWLEEEARQYDLPPCDDPTGVCNRCEHQPGVIYALAVARQINGGEPR